MAPSDFSSALTESPKIVDKFVGRLRGARSALVAVRRRFFAVQLRRKCEVRAGYVFHLLAKRSHLLRTVPGINPAIVTLCGAIAVFVSRHNLSGGAKLIFLKCKITQQDRSYRPELGGGWVRLREFVDQPRTLVALLRNRLRLVVDKGRGFGALL